MVQISTNDLIDKLVAESGPVHRLRPPLVRAAIWLMIVATLAGATILATGDVADMVYRLRGTRFALEMAGTFLTAAGAVAAAFYLSFPDRSRLWLLLPVPPLLLWFASAFYGCYQHWIAYGPAGLTLGVSGNCFVFIVAASVPLAGALFWALKRSAPLDSFLVAAVGGLGVAALAAMILQFFHPFDVTLIDLSAHIAAVLVVIVLMSMSAERVFRPAEHRT